MKLTIIGVSHIWAMFPEVKKLIETINFDHNTKIFLEPKIEIIKKQEFCTEKAIQKYFDNLLNIPKIKKCKKIALNPSIMPSHNSQYLYQKYASQLAEEEYMTEIIAKYAKNNDIIIIGNIHAKRIAKLLEDKSIQTNYYNIAPITPDDIFANNWRDAIEHQKQQIISITWLKEINENIRKKMLLPKNILVQKSCWNNKTLFKRYLALAKRLMIEIKPYYEYFDNETIIRSKLLKNDSKVLLQQAFQEEEHILESY
ncbi:MAG: hypothetical protein ACMXYG_00830 [Candidatus Woesearchaeota archaeon]